MKKKASPIAMVCGVAMAGAVIGFALFHWNGSYRSPSAHSTASSGLPAALQAALREDASTSSRLASLYQARNFRPLWIGESGALNSDGASVSAVLADAASQGLPAELYAPPSAPGARASAGDKARFDLAFSRMAFRYAHDMDRGLVDPGKIFDDVSMPARKDDADGEFAAAILSGQAGSYLHSLEPVGDYARLKAALKTYQKLGGLPWTPISAPATRKDYPAGLAERLQAEGYLATASHDRADIVQGLKAFQAANGLEPSGRLEQETLAALNKTPQEIVAQLQANMERWRWLPRKLGERFILVNVPTASLVMMQGATPVVGSRVVVGAPDKPTPILVTNAVAITINPSWHIPKSIADNEIKPKTDKDPGYLEAKNITEENGSYVQSPGPANALGLVKFEMPNPFDVYLHDTPSKQAFLNDDRALSHGCVRVQAIRPLAAQALGMEEQELGEKIAGGETSRQPLSQPIPVYILYWTALTGSDGKLTFAPDVYGRDAKTIAALRQAAGTRLSSSR